MSKNQNPQKSGQVEKPKQAEPAPIPQSEGTNAAPTLSADLIAKIRAAENIEASVKLLQPDARPKGANADATFIVVENFTEPLPQRKGACLKVVAAAVRLNRPFKVSDITTALPDVKSAAYWTRRLARTGHFAETSAN